MSLGSSKPAGGRDDGNSRRRGAALALLAVGVFVAVMVLARPAGRQWYVFLTVGPWGPAALLGVVALAAAGAGWNPARRALQADLPASARFSVAAALLAGTFFWVTAIGQHRQLFPYVHDESGYLIQAHQLARGRLWFSAHPLGASFDSFQLLTRGNVYASAYFPGTAMLYVPGVWLGLKPYVTSLVLAAAVAGLMHWLISRCVDRTAGHLALLLLLACPMVRTQSVMTMGQIPLLLYALAAMVAFSRWCTTGGARRWAGLAGVFLGLAVITRPVDALCFGLPIVVAATTLLRSRPIHRRRLLVTIFLFGVGLLPCLGLQAICNRGITGRWFTSPFRVYADLDHPKSAYGFHQIDPLARPASDLPQKQDLYRTDYRPLIANHQPNLLWKNLIRVRLPILLSLGGAVTPFPLLAALWPAAWATLSRRNLLRAVLLSTLPLFLILYLPYVFFFPHYMTTALPGTVLGLVLAVWEVPLLWPRYASRVRVFGWLAVAMLAVAAFPQVDPGSDDLFAAPLLVDVNRQLQQIPTPAIVLFHYSPGRNVHEEPVYNDEVAWPDDARVIRAHDLGPLQNAALLRYYARVSPRRVVYRYEESNRTLTKLGTVSALSAAIID